MRTPDLTLTRQDGKPYLLRWHVIPRNRWFNCYLHQFLASDEDVALHDHPWWFVSVVLRGGYWEHRADRLLKHTSFRNPGSVALRSARTAHRVELAKELYEIHRHQETWGPLIRLWGQREKPAWTLIFTGPVLRAWGFHCPNGWQHWNRFALRNGCGEK